MKIGIVGAGINGLYLGWKLSERGHNVTIFERKEEIGNVVCSGLFSKRILDFIPQSQDLIQNKINYVNIHFPKKTIRVDFSKEFLVIDHSELDKLVASLAVKQGVKIIMNNNVSEIPQGFDKIIGCDGANSIIRKSLNLPNPKHRLGILGFINNQDTNDYVDVWPCKNGFIWKIPRNNDIEYGIIADADKATELLDSFLQKNNISLNKKARIIPCGLKIPKNNSITLCGDSAGITKPWSGGGVIWGLFAANMLLDTFPHFKKYRRKTKMFFGSKVIISKIALKVIYFLGFNIPWIIPKKNKIESDFLF